MDSYSIAAKWIVPEGGAPLEDHYLMINDGVIAAIEKTPASNIIDLGHCCLTSPLVNAHCHLDLSDFDRPIPFNGSFVDWLRAVIAHRIDASSQEGAKAKQAAARTRAIDSMIASGTGTVYDVVNTLPQDRNLSHDVLEIVSFAELIAINLERAEQTLKNATAVMLATRNYGFSPHASYTVDHEMLESAVMRSSNNQIPIAMHVAETREEIQWLQDRSGPFHSFLAPHCDEHFLAHGFHSVTEIIERLGRAYRSLLIHGNYLNDNEIDRLASLRDGVAVVYCPRTHAGFGHSRHPIERLLAKGVHVFLGTDSLASNPDLSVWREARFVHQEFPAIAAEIIFRMITDGPRRFLANDAVGKTLAIGGEACFARFELPSDRPINSQNIFEVLLESSHEPELVVKKFVD